MKGKDSESREDYPVTTNESGGVSVQHSHSPFFVVLS